MVSPAIAEKQNARLLGLTAILAAIVMSVLFSLLLLRLRKQKQFIEKVKGVARSVQPEEWRNFDYKVCCETQLLSFSNPTLILFFFFIYLLLFVLLLFSEFLASTNEKG